MPVVDNNLPTINWPLHGTCSQQQFVYIGPVVQQSPSSVLHMPILERHYMGHIGLLSDMPPVVVDKAALVVVVLALVVHEE